MHKTEKNIFIAFILNLGFAIFEFIGGVFTNSVAIMSDAIHDIGDAMSIGVSYFLEKKSKKKADNTYTYGYLRYSILGAVFTSLILLFGSIFVICNAVNRLFLPEIVNYDGMIVFAIIGVVVNFLAAMVTKDGDSLNQKAVNLHMLEDVMGWVVVLIGAILMRSTDFVMIDSILSIGVAVFILMNAGKMLLSAVDLFLEKTPKNISIEEIKEHLLEIDGVLDVHHIHIWSLDGIHNCGTLHIVTNYSNINLKRDIREELKEHNIQHVTIEIENETEICSMRECIICKDFHSNHQHHHHSHNHFH